MAARKKSTAKKSSSSFGGKKAPPFGSPEWQAKYGKKKKTTKRTSRKSK